MSTTLGSMRDEVRLVLGNRDDVTAAMIDSWLNRSQLALASQLRIFEVESVVTFTLDPLQPDPDLYGVPTNLWVPMIMVNRNNSRAEIKLRPIKTIMTKVATPAASPSEYGLRAKTLMFRPAPSAADVIEWLYKMRPATMTDVVNLTLPDEFAEPVVFDACVRGLHLTGEEDRAAIYREHRTNSLAGIGDQRGEEFGQREEGVIITGHEVQLA